jgi:mycothione reductase
MPEQPCTHDVIVIGTGGGTKLALPAAERGLRVALVERDAFGGTCLNRGCIPSKMLIYPAEVADLARTSAAIGVHADNVRMAFDAIMRRTTTAIASISRDNEQRTAAHPNITFVRGHARFVSDHAIQVGPTRLSAPRIFIATGSRPEVPAIPGLTDGPYLTSRELLQPRTLPKHLLVIGAGYIAIELGYAYSVFGVDVQFIVRSRYLRQEDETVSDAFNRAFAPLHTTHYGTPTAVRWTDDTVSVTCRAADGRSFTATGDALLVATGVVPVTDNLGLENTAIRRTDDGFIVVDRCLRTDVPGVHALGDCIGNHFFRHTVNYEGEYLMRTAFASGEPPPLDYGPVPHAVFGHPQVAGVGPTEQALREAGTPYFAGTATYADSTPGMARAATHGLVKVLVDAQTRRLLAAHIVGDEASDMIHLFIVAIKCGATLDDLLDTIFIHPALPEVARDALRNARP